MKISIIAAMDEKMGIGKDNKIPWHISEDFKRFKKITSGHPIIMGRKTWESLLLKPLPERTNIVISRNPSLHDISIYNAELIICNSLKEAIGRAKEILKQVQDDKEKEIFIIGGGQIFKQALPLADKLYLTIVEGDYNCDAFFPDYSAFKKIVFEESKEGEGHKYKFLEIEK